jgi:hypothetical protein
MRRAGAMSSKSVFPPDEVTDSNVERDQNCQGRRMRMSKTVKLIHHEQPEYEQRSRKCPELFPNQTPSDESLCSTVRNQIGIRK